MRPVWWRSSCWSSWVEPVTVWMSLIKGQSLGGVGSSRSCLSERYAIVNRTMNMKTIEGTYFDWRSTSVKDRRELWWILLSSSSICLFSVSCSCWLRASLRDPSLNVRSDLSRPASKISSSDMLLWPRQTKERENEWQWRTIRVWFMRWRGDVTVLRCYLTTN